MKKLSFAYTLIPINFGILGVATQDALQSYAGGNLTASQ
ncbi:hypothetical protein Z949_405 [Sulfitobacter guttiformis KCTC 32187]|uniref:Uncharacterized protein n=1 Tax=Sulfitobacter guttiformis TaxID=74349 RepID=A0A420DTY7_9RHOB|nr:hypothetical protein Z949_405 [Sulfitobacter guttiformis KCTC 32187]RKE97712.1 hypothetical protein C8N30_2333 [Sulfitobacter guttiformis]